jgi:hypothetical protein
MATTKKSHHGKPAGAGSFVSPSPAASLTINGKPIPAEFAHAIAFQYTDQGIEEANRGRVLEKGAGVTVIRAEGFDADMEHRRDAGDGKIDIFTAPDPLKEAIDKVREPGFKYKALSPKVIERRGLRGFEVCRDPKTGQAVTMANMVVGRMPNAVADQRNKHYRDIGNSALAESERHFKAQQEQLIQARGGVGLSVLSPGESLHGADLGGQDRDVTVGLRSQRGNSHFIEEAA